LVRANPSDPLLPLLLLGGIWVLAHASNPGGTSAGGASAGGAAPGGAAPGTNPAGGVGDAPYGPPYDPQLVRTTADGLTIARAPPPRRAQAQAGGQDGEAAEGQALPGRGDREEHARPRPAEEGARDLLGQVPQGGAGRPPRRRGAAQGALRSADRAEEPGPP